MIYYITNNKELFEERSSTIQFGTIPQCLEYLSQLKYIGVDTETEGMDPHTKKLLSLQLGDYHNQYVIDLTTVNIQNFKDILEDNSKILLMQNAKFDLRFLYYHKIIPVNIYDTFLAETVLYMGYPPGMVRKGLDALALKYCNVKLNKSIRGQIHWRGLDNTVIQYAADDVKYLESIMYKQMKAIKREELTNALELDNLFVKVLAYAEFCGLYLNKDLWVKKMSDDEALLVKYKKELDDFIVDNDYTKYIEQQLNLFSEARTCKINWASSDQVVPLMKELGLDTLTKDKKTGEMRNSVEAKVLKPQQDKHPIVPIYLKYKAVEKVVSTYGQNWINQINSNTGRIHTNFTQLINTGRMSSGGKDKANKVEYVNVQNIPADHTRECFTNQYDNTILINCDYTGQESVVFANKCLDKKLLEFYDKNLGDMHSYIAKLCFPEDLEDTKLEDVKKLRPDLRQFAKAAGFAIQFGGQGLTIAQNLNIPIEQGEKVYQAYFNAFTGVKDYFKKCRNSAYRDGFILFNNVTKRKSYIDFHAEYLNLKKNINSDFWEKYRYHKERDTYEFNNELKPLVRKFFKMQGEIERRSYNYPVQGSSADITKLALVFLFNWIIKNNLFGKVLISNIVHDEALLECPVKISEIVAKRLQISMENSGKHFCKRVPLKATPVITKYWQH